MAQGYGDADNTWEPRANLDVRLVREYERAQKKKAQAQAVDSKQQNSPSASATFIRDLKAL